MVETQTHNYKSEFDSVQEALKDFGKYRVSIIPSKKLYLTGKPLAANKFVIVMDNEDRENEGDLIIAAEKITTEQMAFLIRYSR